MIPSEWLVAVASGDSDRETERLVLAAVLSDPALRRRFELLRQEAAESDARFSGNAPSPAVIRRALESVREIAGGGGVDTPPEAVPPDRPRHRPSPTGPRPKRSRPDTR